MSLNTYVRLSSIEISNFKNVANGYICLDSPAGYKASLLGLYGQNGSGKTTLIDSIELLKYFLCGLPVPMYFGDFISKDENEASFAYVFDINDIETNLPLYNVSYSVSIEYALSPELIGNSSNLTEIKRKIVRIKKEDMRYRVYTNGKKSRFLQMADIDNSENDNILKPVSQLKLFLDIDGKENGVEWLVKKRLIASSSRSFIFSKEFIGSLREQKHQKNKDGVFLVCLSILERLIQYGNSELFIINTASSNLISLDTLILFIKNDKGVGSIPIQIKGPTTVPKPLIEIIGSFIANMNIVLEQLIPGLTIVMKEYGEQAMDSGDPGVRIELLSKRGDREIPLRYESDGIKKIISILQLLIFVYNHCSITVAIDELDSGIFEYLLGELLKIISEQGCGQLIFTSHNLRPLETICKDFIFFTTTNSQNRYVRMKNVKACNNLRDFYYRDIIVGTQKEELYSFTNNNKISLAFKKAGGM